MKKQTPKQNTQPSIGSKLSSSVLERIDKEKVTPSPKWHFVFGECFVWMLWALSVLFGAIAISVVLFVGLRTRFAMFEATNETPMAFFIEVLPYLWIFVFITMVILAYINMRKTKRGYKYSLKYIILSSLIGSLIGGALLNFAGVGYIIDTQISTRMPVFESLEEKELRIWQEPVEGRMVGYVSSDEDDELLMAQFTDVNGKQWVLNIKELTSPDLQILYSGSQVRILGILSSTTNDYFHGCGVFPWMFDKDIKLSDIENERNEFIKRMYQHKDKALERLEAIQAETFSTTSEQTEDSVCAKQASIIRIEKMMEDN